MGLGQFYASRHEIVFHYHQQFGLLWASCCFLHHIHFQILCVFPLRIKSPVPCFHEVFKTNKNLIFIFASFSDPAPLLILRRTTASICPRHCVQHIGMLHTKRQRKTKTSLFTPFPICVQLCIYTDVKKTQISNLHINYKASIIKCHHTILFSIFPYIELPMYPNSLSAWCLIVLSIMTLSIKNKNAVTLILWELLEW